MGNFMIEAKSMTKNYKELEAVGGLDLAVPRGENFGNDGRQVTDKVWTLRAASIPGSASVRVRHILTKPGVSNRVEATPLALQNRRAS